jgi:hypothetical protein
MEVVGHAERKQVGAGLSAQLDATEAPRAQADMGCAGSIG